MLLVFSSYGHETAPKATSKSFLSSHWPELYDTLCSPVRSGKTVRQPHGHPELGRGQLPQCNGHVAFA